MKKLLLLLFALLVATPAMAASVSNSPTDWYWRFGTSPALTYGFPTSVFSWLYPKGGLATNDVDYLLTTKFSGLRVGGRIEVAYKTHKPWGGNVMGSTDYCANPAARIIIRRKNDDALTNEDGRWWAYAYPIYTNLPNQTPVSYTVTIAPGNFTNVFGKNGSGRVTQFNDAVANAGEIGITFGGCSFYGHGNKAAGSNQIRGYLLKFKLWDF